MPWDSFEAELADLRADVLAMGELVVDQLADGLAALRTGDPELAEAVLDGDEAVNQRYLDLESRCVELYALQQPVAGDLRLVTASFKILTDLERVGDLACNLGEYALAADGSLAVEVDVDRIGQTAHTQVERALAAYETGDTAACRAVAVDDEDLDAACLHASETVARDLVEREAGADPWDVEALLDDVSRLLLTVRDLERVGDHAVNVAARTLWLVDNDPELLY